MKVDEMTTEEKWAALGKAYAQLESIQRDIAVLKTSIAQDDKTT